MQVIFVDAHLYILTFSSKYDILSCFVNSVVGNINTLFVNQTVRSERNTVMAQTDQNQAAIEAAQRATEEMEEEGRHCGPDIIYHRNVDDVVEITAVNIGCNDGGDDKFKQLVEGGWICMRIQTERVTAGIYNYGHRVRAYLAKTKSK